MTTMKLTALYMKEKLIKLALIACLFITPLIGLAQDETPPGPVAEGQDPGAVPFDSNMNIIFLTLGVLFAVVITVRQLRKRSSSVAS